MHRVTSNDIAAYCASRKFHHETTCGEDGMHWAECDQLTDWLGWDSYEEWETACRHETERRELTKLDPKYQPVSLSILA